MTALRSAMLATPGVVGVHDLHVWTVTSGLVALSGHIEVTDDQRWPTTLDTLSTLLRDRFAIHHATLQPEEPHPQPNSFRGCSLDSPAGRAACRVSSRRPAIAEPGHRH
jgi:cobalt-zinc-cadmium efflux system protein